MEKEERWIRAIIKRGSRRAADSLVQYYYDDIYGFVYRQVGNPEDALDVTQECFIAALQSLPSYDPAKAGFRTWLYRVAAHKVADLRRRLDPPKVSLDELTLPLEEDFTAAVLNRELLTRIENYIIRSEPEVWEIYRLRVYAGYRFPEIAACLGEPEAKLKARYYRLVGRLRKEFLEDE